MFTIEEIDAMTNKMAHERMNRAEQSATDKLVAIRKIMQDTGIKELKIIL